MGGWGVCVTGTTRLGERGQARQYCGSAWKGWTRDAYEVYSTCLSDGRGMTMGRMEVLLYLIYKARHVMRCWYGRRMAEGRRAWETATLPTRLLALPREQPSAIPKRAARLSSRLARVTDSQWELERARVQGVLGEACRHTASHTATHMPVLLYHQACLPPAPPTLHAHSLSLLPSGELFRHLLFSLPPASLYGKHAVP